MTPELTDTRRLTGPNLWLDGPGAIIEVAADDDALPDLVAAWREELRSLFDAVGWGEPEPVARLHAGGASLAFPGPIDVLYAACELNEAAWHAAVARVTGTEAPDRDETVARLKTEIAEERDDRWLDIEDEAASRDVPFLWDDDEFSVGLGPTATVWTTDALPDVADISWPKPKRIPTVLVTGTNGKSTTVRMLAAVLRAAGLTAGSTSTDGIHVGDEVVDTGDFSGPGGARTLLRRNDVEAAVLEVARGGMLRRGLPIDRADVSIVTNISEDHLGEYGILDLDDLAQAKLVVSKAVRRSGLLVLNADDEKLVQHAPDDVVIGWCSQDPDHWVVNEHVDRGGRAWVVREGWITEVTAARELPIVEVATVPATLGGAAQHNVANALSAVAAARRLEISPDVIARALAGFRGDTDDNPGRANVFTLGERTIVVDFAHNVAGMTAIAQTIERMPAERRLVMFGQAGDRPDDAIRDLAGAVWATSPDHVIAVEVPSYLRGREPGELPALIVDELIARGATAEAVATADSPLDGVRAALDWSRPGDVLLLMVLEQRDEVVAWLRDRGATPA